MIPKRLRDLLSASFVLIPGMVALAGPPAPHPRLILTPPRIAQLKATLATSRRELWTTTAQSAADFSALAIPAMRDAGNRHRTLGDTMPVLGLAYHITGERHHVTAADRWLNAMLDVSEWRGSQNLGRSAWVVGSALLYDWLSDSLPAATRERLRARLVAEGEILLRETSYWRLLSNHCLIETSALGMIGLALDGEHERAAAFLATARERADLIIEHAPRDGSWGEGIQYWQYGLGYFLRYLEAARTSGHHDYFPRYAWLQQTGTFGIQFSLPGAPRESVNFADSGMGDYVAGCLYFLPASIYRNGHYQDFGNRTRPLRPYKFSWLDFITYDPTVAPIDFTTLPAFHHFADHGFVIMRSGWKPGDTLVAFHCGPGPGHRNQEHPLRLERRGFGPGHAHPDTNSFAIFAHGQWLAIDPGYVHEKWTRDENTILVNGRGQAGEGREWLDYMAFQERRPVPRVLRAETHPDFDTLIGDAGNIYVDEAGLGHFRRHLLFLKPDIVVLLDDIAVTKPSRLQWRLQAHERASQTGPGEFEIERAGVRLSVRPLLPARYDAQIETRPLRASETSGSITTLRLDVESTGAARILVVLTALADAMAKKPVIGFNDGRLTIVTAGRSWSIDVREPAPADDPTTPLLTVHDRDGRTRDPEDAEERETGENARLGRRGRMPDR